MCFVNSIWSAKKVRMQKCAHKKKKIQKIIKHWNFFSSLVLLTRHFTKFIFLEQLTAMPQFNRQNMLLFFLFYSKQSSWYEPFTSFVSFSYKNIIIYWLISTVNHQGLYFPFFVFIQWVKHFWTPANFVTIWSTVLNNKKKYIQLMFWFVKTVY